ncbi:MAG: copper homeostasis protein CutC [Bacteroidetes bacterium]|nr:copper homeostasis protein CutC [Bacteroidota bacterium]
MKPRIRIEVCCGSAQSAINAQTGGAHRVELCQNPEAGGTTPSAGEILMARNQLSIDLNILIRPRGGDFLYSEHELAIVRQDILFCKSVGVNGVAIGFLTKNGDIDQRLTTEMIELAHPMSVTFHRAFDMCREPETALEQLIGMGVDRLLTSGQQPTAAAGSSLIKQLVQQAGKRLVVMPGSGIREHNIQELIEKTGAPEYHVSARKTVVSSMEYCPVGVPMGKYSNNYEYQEIDGEVIRRLVNKVNQNG